MELFELTHLGKKYYFTSHKEDIINGNVYKAIPINRKEITRSLKKSGIIITAPIGEKPFNTMINSVSADLSDMSIYRYPEDVLLFKGRVIKINMDYGKKIVELSVGQKTQLGNSMIPNRTYSTTCGYNFCDSYCGLAEGDYAFIINKGDYSVSPDGYTITSDTINNIPNKYKDMVAGGYVNSSSQVSFINKYNKGKSIELLSPFYNINDSKDSITIHLVCDKSFFTCRDIYNNAQRYGGFPFIPINNINSGKF